MREMSPDEVKALLSKTPAAAIEAIPAPGPSEVKVESDSESERGEAVPDAPPEGEGGQKRTKGTKRAKKKGTVKADPAADVPGIVAGELSCVVNPKKFLGILQKLKPASSGKGALPVLSCVRMTAVGCSLRMEVTNLDLYAEATLTMSEEADPGTVLVSLPRLMELVKLADKEDLFLEALDEKLILRCGDWKATLLTLDPAEFPQAPQGERVGEPLVIGEAVLNRMLALAVVAVSVDETRYVLNGVRIATLEKGLMLRAEATDGRRLVRADVPVDVDIDVPELLLPSATVRVLQGFLTAGEEEVTLVRTDRQVECTGPGWKVQSKLIEGNYPNTEAVMPRHDDEVPMSLDRALLVEMIERAGVLANGGDEALRFAIQKTGAVTINSNTVDVGEWDESLPVCAEKGRPQRVVKFTARAGYLAALAGPACEQVRLQAGEEPGKEPLLWSCVEPVGGNGRKAELTWRYVLMPLKVAE